MKLRQTLLTGLSLSAVLSVAAATSIQGNRLAYLDGSDPFYVDASFPKLTTPQWVGEPGVDAVVTLGIDDLRESGRYETFLRPILEALKAVEGRASLSIFCNALDPEDPQLQKWLEEGLSLEVHTLSHPCPILAKGNFEAASQTFHGGVELLNRVSGNTPVAFRTPCCDSINSPSPRVYAEIFSRTNAAGQFLRMDSSVLLLLTSRGRAFPKDLVVEGSQSERFMKYVPFPSFVTTVENYPYPWVINRLCWEFACMAPSDWEGQNILGNANPAMLADWERALDLVVQQRGLFNFVFHPYGWSSSQQFVDFIENSKRKYGGRVRFLNYREAHERLTTHLGAGQALRNPHGGDNGLRMVDLDNDGILDVLIGNPGLRQSRLWKPREAVWHDSDLPVDVVEKTADGVWRETGVRFGVIHSDGRAMMLVRNDYTAGAWVFTDNHWVAAPELLEGLEIGGEPVRTASHGKDNGVRLRDIDGDGVCEVIVGNATQRASFSWDADRNRWQPVDLLLPSGTSVVNQNGEDNGLRFVDLNEDGLDDVVFSNEERFGVWLFQPEVHLGWERGWTRRLTGGERTTNSATELKPVSPGSVIPPIVREGPYRNNGAWFHSRHLWFQNEDTAHLTNLVDRRAFDDLLRGDIPAPLSTNDARASLRVAPGFKVDLAAAEPLVQDPVALDWGADGKLWVAEMRDYPSGMDGAGRPGGVIKFLEDTNDDGIYDRSTDFLKDVRFPSGVMAWRKGVLISAAPDVFYAEDSDGDGKADLREVVLTGFVEGNQQHRVNGFALGLDGWVYGANGDSGGTITSPRSHKTISLRGSDFRFKPDAGALEAIEGQTQFGRTRDDWGRWYGNANYEFLWEYPWPAHYLARNPYSPVSDLRWRLTRRAGGNRLFPLSRALPRPNVVGEENTATSACSPAPYRDDLFGVEFATSVFVAEPSENLVHREVLRETRHGARSERAAGEEFSEFLASTDVWFRPVFVRTGPDGALYIVDMYRLTIEHPEWIPPDVKSRLDLRAGEDRGRIYRVLPTGTTPRRVPRLHKLGTRELAAALDTPNGTRRDMAARLLLEQSAPVSGPELRRFIRSTGNPKARLQALALLGALGVVNVSDVNIGLRDEHPAVRSEALRLSERFLQRWRESLGHGIASDPELTAMAEKILSLTPTAEGREAIQLAFTLGEWPDSRAGKELTRLALRHPDNEMIQTAVASSAPRHLGAMLGEATTAGAPWGPLLNRLLGLAVAMEAKTELQEGVRFILQSGSEVSEEARMRAVRSVFEMADARGVPVSVRPDLLQPLFERARDLALDEQAGEDKRISALELLAAPAAATCLPTERLSELLKAGESGAIQGAAIAALAGRGDSATPDSIIRAWPDLSPGLREKAMEVMLARRIWITELLSAIETGRLSARSLPLSARERLLSLNDADQSQRAARVLSQPRSDRRNLVRDISGLMKKSGDARHGWDLFRENCAACHRFREEGNDVGPDLGAVLDKTPEALLLAILDPNSAVEDRYLAYTAVLRDGREFTGIVSSESDASVTLKTASGAEEVFSRRQLRTLRSTGRSLMPEGFETILDSDGLADLVALLRGASVLSGQAN